MGGTSTALITGVVLFSAILHAVWNALTHAIEDKIVGIVLLSSGFVVLGLVAIPFVGFPALGSVPFLVASGLVQALYVVSLMRAYRLGDFNQAYPIARGTSPWVVAFVAATFLHESLSALQIVGVVVVSIGLGSLVFAKGRPHKGELPAVAAAFLTGLLISSYTLIDGVGVRRAGDAFAYAAWQFVIHGAGLVAYAWIRRGRTVFRDAARHWRPGALAGGCSALAYGLVLWAQSVGELATVAALRETSVIVGAVIGALVFKEPFGRWRTVATVVVATGIALLDLG